MPAALVATSNDPSLATCLASYGQLGFNGTAALDPQALYVLEFMVASV